MLDMEKTLHNKCLDIIQLLDKKLRNKNFQYVDRYLCRFDSSLSISEHLAVLMITRLWQHELNNYWLYRKLAYDHVRKTCNRSYTKQLFEGL